jgi:hypothetical protein
VVKGTKEEAGSLEGASAKYLADRWGFPFREAHTLSIDPTVLEILDREESKRLRVLPLEHGPDGPVFAVAEPSEERFAAVRDIAGDNASFVIVAKDTLDALLNSKVFSVSGVGRRASLFRTESHDTLDNGFDPIDEHRQEEAHADVHAAENDYRPEEPQYSQDEHPAFDEHHAYDQNGSAMSETETQTNGSDSTEALDQLLNQIAAGTGSLRAQVDTLNESLETAQRELREANEQLAEATRANEVHEELVAGLRAEADGLRAELERSTSMNASITARLEDLVHALTPPVGNDETGEG